MKGAGISFFPHYHFHPLQRHLDISQTITAESAPLHMGSSRTRTGTFSFQAHVANHQKYQNFEVKLGEAEMEQDIAIITTPRVSYST